jgi:hypothetical protein
MPRRVAPAVALFFLSPLVGEYMFGNVSIDAIGMLFIFAPMYGAGAVLIREFARRTGRGWPTIFLLGLAYGVIEEGLVTQLLFNPSYSTYGVEVTGPTYLPSLGINAVMTLSVVTLHTIWSICVPIAIVEAFAPRQRTAPWLGGFGLTVAAVVFLLGSSYIAVSISREEGFLASAPQLIGTLLATALLITVALCARGSSLPRTEGPAPSPWIAGAMSLAITSGLMLVNVWTLGRSVTREGPLSGWVSVAVWFALVGAAVVLIMHWSRSDGWGAAHHLALAGGALLTYALVAFPQEPIVGSTGAIDLTGNIIFLLGAIALLAAAASALRRYRPGT